ncbi:hypothetical protein BD311DRAFT_749512 [Dichomitus squalens]|uniref:Uncharacterized protein n=1 Tax=Dichomitus squalens TaxID=114155 RepID=A0A4Q9MYP8_9APHY|nr:hypothetical protein BD311DRAFT_749512 [Dichomitus squalens]
MEMSRWSSGRRPRINSSSTSPMRGTLLTSGIIAFSSVATSIAIVMQDRRQRLGCDAEATCSKQCGGYGGCERAGCWK